MADLATKINQIERETNAIKYVLGIGGENNELVKGYQARSAEFLEGYLKELQVEKNILLAQQQQRQTDGAQSQTEKNSFERILNTLDAISQQQQTLLSQVEPVLATVTTLDLRITPSEACKSAHLPNIFSGLMSTLTLPIIDLPMVEDINVTDCSYKEFEWDWEGKDESDSYTAVLEYLRSIDVDCECIASGENLPNGLLYEVDIYALRPRSKTVDEIIANSVNQSYQDLSKKYTLSGRSDIFVYKTNPRLLYRLHCEYCIEIKTANGMKQRSSILMSLREACLQLVGLNVDNPYKSPAVILTNLIRKNYVMYLTISDSPEEKLYYNLHVLSFSEFRQAIWWVQHNLFGRPSCTNDFGRAPSVRNSAINIDDKEEDVDFENVQVTEAMDVDALEGIP